ncbi:MAG TPA: imidazoleglycerol-phosphate dehydratase HisB [bacterium]|nr:imidazoleglycerol-phosphate dehydratase HisB [bacterium]
MSVAGRQAEVERTTRETTIRVRMDLDRADEVAVATGVPFFDHMLQQVGIHGRFGFVIDARGDLAVDAHHTVEDTGIVLGQAIRQAIGDGRGIARFGSVHLPMDDALVLIALDLSGRPYLHYALETPPQLLGTFSADLTEEFFRALVAHGGLTLHLLRVHGRALHHVVEAAFKGFGVALAQAVRVTGGSVPSSKGVVRP